MIMVSKFAPRFIPLGKMTEFHRQPSRLNRLQQAVIAFDVVVVLFCMAVVANQLHSSSHVRVVCGGGSGFSARAQIFARIEAESRGFSHRSCELPGVIFLGKILRPVRLTRILDYEEVVPRRKLQDWVHVRSLAVQMNGHNSSDATL